MRTIPYKPEDTAPYYDPLSELEKEHVDPGIWPAVREINRSGWVWTIESCEGHEDAPQGTGKAHEPMLRLACRADQRWTMIGLLVDSLPVGDIRNIHDVHMGRLKLEMHSTPPEGWFEIKVWVLSGGVEVFERFAERIR